MITLSNLQPPEGSKKTRRRRGRGPGSGLGKTSGRGHKGQHARSGGHVEPWFESGNFPLALRLPKRGFTNNFGQTYQVVNLESLEKLQGNEVTPETLAQSGIIKNAKLPVKILAVGDVSRALNVKDVSISKPAAEKITKAGGTAEMPKSAPKRGRFQKRAK